MDRENIFPKFISNQLPEGTRPNSKIFLALAGGHIVIGALNLLIDPLKGYYIPYFIFGTIMLAAYYYDFHYKINFGLLFTKEKIQNDISRRKRFIIVKSDIGKIEIRFLEIDFIMKDGSINKIGLGDYTYKSVQEIKELSLEFARLNGIPFIIS